MPQEVITAIVSAVSVGLTLGVQRIITLITRSREERNKEKADAMVSTMSAEESKIHFESVEDAYYSKKLSDAYQTIKDLQEIVNEERSKWSDLARRLSEAEKTIADLTLQLIKVNAAKRKYKTNMEMLIEAIKAKCCDIDTSEYEEDLIEDKDEDEKIYSKQ